MISVLFSHCKDYLDTSPDEACGLWIALAAGRDGPVESAEDIEDGPYYGLEPWPLSRKPIVPGL